MPPLGGPGPRRVNQAAVRRRRRNLAKAPPTAKPVYVPPAAAYRSPKPVYGPPRPVRAPAPRESPLLRDSARPVESRRVRGTTQRQQVGSYLARPVAERRPEIKRIKAIPVAKRTAGERKTLELHGKRQIADVRARAGYGGRLPRATYEVWPEAAKPLPEPKGNLDSAIAKASPKLTAAISTSPKLKAQLSGMLAAGKSSEAALATLKEQKEQRAATVEAPALKALDYTMRPGYAVLGSVKKDIERGGLGEAFAVHAPGSKAAKQRRVAMERGITGKERTTGSDVLGAAGWKPKGTVGKAARAVAGLSLDMAANPLSYAQGGVGTVAERAGAKAAGTAARAGIGEGAAAAAARDAPRIAAREAKRVERKARVAGRTPEQARRAGQQEGQRAAREHVVAAQEQAISQVAGQARKAAPAGRGVVVRLGGQEIPGIRRATAAVGRGAGRVVPKAIPRGARKAARAVRPTIAEHAYPTAQFEAGLHASASARAAIAHAERKAVTLGQHLKTNLPKDSYDDVIRALERNDIKSLPEDLRDTVINLRSALRQHFREGRRAGVIKGEVGDFGNWLKQGEARKLLKTIESEVSAQTRRVAGVKRQVERAGARLRLASADVAGRQRVSDVRLTEQERRRAALAREREIGSARVGVERARGGQALSTQRQLQAARRQLKAELAKPVAKRQGVAALEARIQRLRPPEPSEPLVAAQQRLATARAPKHPSREQWIAQRTKANERDTPTLERLTENIKPGKPGTSIESQHVKQRYRDGEFAGWGQEIPGSKVVVHRDAHGNPIGALEMHLDEAGKPRQLSVAVHPEHRGKGIGSSLYAHATKHGYDVEAASGKEGLTEAGAALQHKRLTAAKPKPAAKPVSSVRVQRATVAHGERVQDFEAQVARTHAAKDIPAKRPSESDEAYLTRLRDYARTHNLPLIEQRATTLLEAKPEMTRGYFPREFESRIQKRFGIKKAEVGKVTGKPLAGTSKKVSRITAGYRRADQGPLHEVNVAREAKGQEPFTTNVPSAALNYSRETGKASAEAGLARQLGEQGRQFKPPTIRRGESVKDFAARRAAAAEQFAKSASEDEQLYFLGSRGGKYDLHEVDTIKGRAGGRTSAQAHKKATEDPGWAARQALKPVRGESGRYVIANKQMVEELRGRAAPQSDLLAPYDRALGRWKGLAIANPAFHIRNLIGDIHTASYEQPLLNLLTRTGPQAAKAIRRESARGRVIRPTEAGRSTRFQRALAKTPLGVPGEHATIKVAGQRQPLDDFIKQAHEDGIIDAGYVGSEVRDLLSQGAQEVRGIRKAGIMRKAGHTTARWTRNRENVTRLATYKAALDRGLTRAQARRVTADLHVDYGHLSELERRGLRRVAPFYTWTARSIPLTAKKYVTRPGKFAAFESAREETGKAFGVSEDDARAQLTAAQQRGLPFVIRLPGRKEPVALSWSDPMALLGNVPTGKEFPSESMRLASSQLTPFIKAPIELKTGKNLVTGADIEGKRPPAAPSTVVHAIQTGAIPDSIVRKLKIIPPKGSPEAKRAGVPGHVDDRTGKPAWGWRGNADYVYDQALLGLGGQIAGAIGAGRSPAQEKLQSFGALAGARFDPLSKETVKRAAQEPLRKEADQINARQEILRNVGVTAEHPNAEYKRNLKRLRELNQKLYPRVKKPRKTGGGFGGGGFGGGDFGKSGGF